MAAVMIGIDPHKGSHTAVAIGAGGEPLGELRVRACAAQAQRLLAWAAAWLRGDVMKISVGMARPPRLLLAPPPGPPRASTSSAHRPAAGSSGSPPDSVSGTGGFARSSR